MEYRSGERLSLSPLGIWATGTRAPRASSRAIPRPAGRCRGPAREGTGLAGCPPGRDEPGKLAPGERDEAAAGWRPEGTGPRKAVARKDGASQAGARIREGPSRPRPGQAVAVAGAAGYVGSAEGSSREGHGRDTDPSPKSDVVTEMPGTSLFPPSSSDVAIT